MVSIPKNTWKIVVFSSLGTPSFLRHGLCISLIFATALQECPLEGAIVQPVNVICLITWECPLEGAIMQPVNVICLITWECPLEGTIMQPVTVIGLITCNSPVSLTWCFPAAAGCTRRYSGCPTVPAQPAHMWSSWSRSAGSMSGSWRRCCSCNRKHYR